MGPPGILRGPNLGPNHGMFSKHNGRGPLGSKGYPHTSFNSGKFPDTYTGFHIGVTPNEKYQGELKIHRMKNIKKVQVRLSIKMSGISF